MTIKNAPLLLYTLNIQFIIFLLVSCKDYDANTHHNDYIRLIRFGSLFGALIRALIWAFPFGVNKLDADWKSRNKLDANRRKIL